MINRNFLLILVFLVASCTTTYKPTETPNAATLVFNPPNLVSAGATNANIFIFPDYGASCINSQLLGNFYRGTSAPIKTKVIPNKELTIQVDFIQAQQDVIAGGAIINYASQAYISFVPEKNVIYEVSFKSKTEPVVEKVEGGKRKVINTTPVKKC